MLLTLKTWAKYLTTIEAFSTVNDDDDNRRSSPFLDTIVSWPLSLFSGWAPG